MKKINIVSLAIGFLSAVALAACSGMQDERARPYALPTLLEMGQTVDDARPLIEQACISTEELRYTGDMAAPAKEQIQINCEGLFAFGASRRVEFMFNDGVLGFAWILTEHSEAEMLRIALAREFGPVLYSNDDYAVFSSRSVALRAQPAEILVATPELMRDITGLGE